MNTIIAYTIVYLLSLTSYILFNNNPIVDTLFFFSFLVSSLLFVFTKEEMPKAKYTNIPQVHNYHKSRINSYGYVMAVALAGFALLYYILTINFKFRSGILIGFMWLGMICISYAMARYIAQNKELNNIKDYIMNTTEDQYPELEKVIEYINSNNGKSDEEILSLLQNKNNFKQITRDDLELTIKIYFNYFNKVQNKLTSEEISEINKQ